LFSSVVPCSCYFIDILYKARIRPQVIPSTQKMLKKNSTWLIPESEIHSPAIIDLLNLTPMDKNFPPIGFEANQERTCPTHSFSYASRSWGRTGTIWTQFPALRLLFFPIWSTSDIWSQPGSPDVHLLPVDLQGAEEHYPGRR